MGPQGMMDPMMGMGPQGMMGPGMGPQGMMDPMMGMPMGMDPMGGMMPGMDPMMGMGPQGMMDLGGGMGMGMDPMGNVILGMDMGPMGPDIFIMGGPGEEIHGHIGDIFGDPIFFGPDPDDPIGDIFGDPIFFGPDPDDPYVDNYIEPTTTTTTVTFSEVVTATTGNDALEGATGNTNFTMAQGTTLGGTDTATDQGGTDGMTFENINNANIKVALVAGGTTVAYAKEGLTYDAGTVIGQVSFTNIENLYVQDSVGGAAEKLSLDMSGATGTGIAVAGTTGNDTIDLSAQTGYLGAHIWGQGGVDTIEGGSGSDQIYGGAGADVITGNDGQDRIYPGDGADDIHFKASSQYGANQAAAKHDWIYGFTTTSDEIKILGTGFSGADSTITKTEDANGDADLVVGAGLSTAGHASQRFIYNTSTGELFYDDDGINGVSPVLIALVLNAAGDSSVTIAAGDIDIV